MGRTMIDRSVRQALAMIVGTVLLAACTSTVAGTARPASAPGPAVPPSSTAPPAPSGVIPPPPRTIGTQLEALRIASVTSLVPVTFPERTESCLPFGPYLDSAELEAAYFPPGTAASLLDRYGFVASFGQCQVDIRGMSTTTLVMELSDPASAEQAAGELASAAAQGTDQQRTVLPDTEHRALVLSSVDGETVQAWAAVGRMVAYVFHVDVPGEALDGAGRVMADQTSLLAGFTPTPQADVPNLPPDPDGLAGRAVDPPGEPLTVSGPYDLEGYLRLAIDPFRERDVLLANGFTGMYLKQTADATMSYAVSLYAFPTSAQTNAVYVAFADLEREAFNGTPFTLPSIPDAPCFVFPTGSGDSTFYQRCYVGFGSFLAGVDVAGLATADDVAQMNELLPAQRDLIAG